MATLILVLHGILSICIIAVILMQQGKGADVGSSFGGGSSQTIFGAPGGGNVLSHATAVLAALFFLTSFGLAVYTGRDVDSSFRVTVPPELQQQQQDAQQDTDPLSEEESQASDAEWGDDEWGGEEDL